MKKEREFKVGRYILKKVCPVCKKKLQLGEKVVLCPMQRVKEGWGNVIAIPVHSKCYWVEK